MKLSQKITLSAALTGLLMSSTLMAAADTAKKTERTFTYALKGTPHSLDPMTVYDVPTHSFGVNIYDALVDRDQKLNLQPGLALEWKNTSDLVWRFKLRQNVKFHDGSPFTADDVVFSFARATGKGSDVSGAVASIDKIVKIDDFTVDVYTKQKNPLLPAEIFSLSIFSKIWCEKNKATNVADVTKKEEGYADMHANGTGAFMVESYKPDVEIKLVKNPNWWGGAEKVVVDRAIFKPIGNDATRMAGLLSGELDMIAPVPLQDIERVKANSSLKMQESEATLTVYLGMNQFDDKLKSSGLDKNPFKDKRVRQAIYHAVDINAIHKKVMLGYSKPTGVLAGPGVNGYDKALDTRLEYSVDKAKSLLKEAGYPDGFKVAMDCSNDRYTKDEMICQSVAQMLAKVGVKVNLTTATKSKFFQKALSYDVDFYMMGWMPATYDAHDFYYNLLATRKGGNQGKFNIGGFSNAKMDELVEKIHTEMDQTKRNAMIGEAMKIAKEEVGNIPLHQEKLVWGMKKDLNIPIRPDDFIILKDIR